MSSLKIWYPNLKFYDKPILTKKFSEIALFEGPKKTMKYGKIRYYDLSLLKNVSPKMIKENILKGCFPVINLKKLYETITFESCKENKIVSKLLDKGLLFYYDEKEAYLARIPTYFIIFRLSKLLCLNPLVVRTKLRVSYKRYFLISLTKALYHVDFHKHNDKIL